MYHARIPATVAAVCFAAALALAADPPAAVVASLDGPVTMVDASGQTHPVHAFDWLNPETTLQTGAGARVTIAFSNGRRYEMRENARLTVVAAGATNLSGPVHPLAPLPPMPKLPAVAPGSGASSQSGAVRVRSMAPEHDCRYPRDGYTVAADHAVLRVKPPDGSDRVEIIDPSGSIIYTADTPSPEISVPPGTLKPGLHYIWRARAPSGTVLDQAEFTTLSADNAAQRASYMASFPQRDADTLAFLAEVDRRLGLLMEAREELREAASHTPHPASIDSLLSEIEAIAGK